MGKRRKLLPDENPAALSTAPLALLRPEAAPLEVAVDITEPQVTDEQYNAAMAQLGLTKISVKSLNALHDIGIRLGGLGVARVQNGVALVSQQRLLDVLNTLSDMAETAKSSKKKTKVQDVCYLGRTAGYVLRAISDSQKVLLQLNGGPPRRSPGLSLEDEKPANRAFVPGQDVKAGATNVVAKEVHIHQGATLTESGKSE